MAGELNTVGLKTWLGANGDTVIHGSSAPGVQSGVLVVAERPAVGVVAEGVFAPGGFQGFGADASAEGARWVHRVTGL
jgi:hypothetical protein